MDAWEERDLFTQDRQESAASRSGRNEPAATASSAPTLPDSAAPFTADWYEDAASCTFCPLAREGGRGATGWTGTTQSPLMIVGEGPGGVEDEYGVPLVGPSGQLLDRALRSVGITRDRVYVTNVVKCRPRGNRTPTLAEGNVCAQRWLMREIGLIRPAAIVALGKVALRFFLGHDSGIIRARGNWLSWHGIAVMPTFHPAYLLRLHGKEERDAKWQVYYDLLAAKEKATARYPEYRWQTEPAPDPRAPFEERRRQRLTRG